jgi:hypothetical protein
MARSERAPEKAGSVESQEKIKRGAFLELKKGGEIFEHKSMRALWNSRVTGR